MMTEKALQALGLIEMATKLGNHLIHRSFFNCAVDWVAPSQYGE